MFMATLSVTRLKTTVEDLLPQYPSISARYHRLQSAALSVVYQAAESALVP